MEGNTNTNVVATPVVQTEAPKKTLGQKIGEFFDKPVVKGLVGVATAVGAGGAAGHYAGKKAGTRAGYNAGYDAATLASARKDVGVDVDTEE